MKFIVQWNGLPSAELSAIERFMKTGGKPPEGVKLLGRWHATAGLQGVAIVEADDTRPLATMALEWGDLLSMTISPAMTDEDLGAVLAADQAARK